MSVVETVLLALGFVAAATSVVVRSPRLSENARLSTNSAGVAFVALVAIAITRWVATGHPPIFGTYENSIASSVAVLGAVLWLDLKTSTRVTSWHTRLLAIWVPITLIYGQFFSTQRLPLTISERSLWVDLHATFAWAAYAVLLSASMAGIARLIEADSDVQESLDSSVFRGIGMGFALFTGVIVVGSIYTHELFAEWFRWEIVEVFSATTWLAYGLALHARLMSGWRGRRLAWLAIVIVPLLLASFWSWSLYQNTYHFFDIVPVPAF
ncbi:MAG: cytochrome c biogenesis protein CcsA [Actinomycetota bacterium]|nr:cytochrome c biogenesis protein CcsA [Actinomycetota bacterium]